MLQKCRAPFGVLIMLGLHCRSDPFNHLDCQKFPTERNQWLVHDFYSSAIRSYPIAARALKTPHDFSPTENPIAARAYRSQQDPFTICSRTARLILDSYTNNTRQTRLMRVGLIFPPVLKERIQGQCACVRSGSDRVHSRSDRVCSSSVHVRSGSDRVK